MKLSNKPNTRVEQNNENQNEIWTYYLKLIVYYVKEKELIYPWPLKHVAFSMHYPQPTAVHKAI